MTEGTEEKKQRKARRVLQGIVTSAHKTPKTLRVEVQYLVRHPIYGKYMRRRTRVHVHDEKGEAKLGDRVQVMECRPISKTKTWRLTKIIESAPV